MVTGRKATAEDRVPIPVGDYQIECVTEFPYLGSVIASSGRMQPDIDRRIAQASRAFQTHAGQCSAIGTLEWSGRFIKPVSSPPCCTNLSAGHLSGKISRALTPSTTDVFAPS